MYIKTIAAYAAILATPLIKYANKMTNELDFSFSSWNPFTVDTFVMSNVPSTIMLCSGRDDIMTDTKVFLEPDPPIKGENLSVVISGILQERINDGSIMYVNIKKGLVKFPQLKIPTCDYITNGCPVEKGLANIEMKFELPNMMPSGMYDVKAVLYNNDQKLNENIEIWKVPKMVKKSLKTDISSSVLLTGKQIACAEGQIQL